MRPKPRSVSMAVLIACAVGLLFGCGPQQKTAAAATPEIGLVASAVQRQLSARMDLVQRQVAGFAGAVAADRDFCMKLLVDKDKSAPEVTEIAQRFLAPMGFSVLSVIDSQYVILSCGHFPANAGTVFSAARSLGAVPAFIMDNVMGQSVLTVQAKVRFTIIDTAVFFACGGITADKDFISKLACWPGYSLLIKQGTTIVGSEKIESISDVNNGAILINNKSYPAAVIPLPFVGPGDQPTLIVVSNKPAS